MQAVNTWWSGVKLDNYCIAGVGTVWIGRWAKVLGLVASITILIDLIGEERVHRASRELAGALSKISLWRPFEDAGLFSRLYASLLRLSILTSVTWLSSLFVKVALREKGGYADTALYENILGIVAVSSISLKFLGSVVAVVPIMLAALSFFSFILSRPALCWNIRVIAGSSLLTSWLVDLIVSS